MASDSTDRGTALGVGVLASAAAVGVGIAAGAAAAIASLPLAPSIAFVVSLLPALAMPRGIAQVGPRGGIYAALIIASFAPVVILGAGAALDAPLVHHEHSYVQHQLFELVASASLFVLLGGVPLSILCWALVGREERPRVDRALRIAPLVHLAGAVLLVLFAVRSHRARVEPRDWRSSVPVVAGVDERHFQDLADEEPKDLQTKPERGRRLRAETPHGELWMQCDPQEPCTLSFRASGAKHPRGQLAWGKSDLRYRIRHDEVHALYIVEERYGQGAGRSAPFTVAGEPLPTVDVAHVHDALAPPAGWTLGAALGIALAIGILLVGRRRRRGATRTEQGVETFRTSGASVRVVMDGARATQARNEETACAAWALGVLALTSGPLVACLYAGLLH